ncbi:hypothetical protein THOM_2749, partial [Trachipleistophora hominis]
VWTTSVNGGQNTGAPCTETVREPEVRESKEPSHQLVSRVRAYLDEDGYGELEFDSGEGA